MCPTDEESEMNRVSTAHEFEAILWTLRDPDTTLLKLTCAGTHRLRSNVQYSSLHYSKSNSTVLHSYEYFLHIPLLFLKLCL